MRNYDTTRGAAEAMATLTRRSLLTGAAVAAATVAETAQARVDVLSMSDEQMLEACIGQLKSILQRMQPQNLPAFHHFNRDRDGGFRLTLNARPKYQTFGGDGFYSVSCDGYPISYWLQEVFQKTNSGKFFSRHLWAYQWCDNNHDGVPDYFAEPRYMSTEAYIVASIDLPSGVSPDNVPFHLAKY